MGDCSSTRLVDRRSEAMSNGQTQQVAPGPREAPNQTTSTEIEQAIERIGARYITDLRTLSEEFGRFYAAQLGAKDKQIAELRDRLASVERERDMLAAQTSELKRSSTKYIANLQALSQEISQALQV